MAFEKDERGYRYRISLTSTFLDEVFTGYKCRCLCLVFKARLLGVVCKLTWSIGDGMLFAYLGFLAES